MLCNIPLVFLGVHNLPPSGINSDIRYFMMNERLPYLPLLGNFPKPLDEKHVLGIRVSMGTCEVEVKLSISDMFPTRSIKYSLTYLECHKREDEIRFLLSRVFPQWIECVGLSLHQNVKANSMPNEDILTLSTYFA
jgi:hypothetical protein